MGKLAVIYTSIFGEYDNLVDPTYVDPRYDYICFTDNTNLKSTVWKIIPSIPLYNDPNRCAKKFKILPHRFLSEYEYSIWIDGNIDVISNTDQILEEYLADANMTLFDHNQNVLDPRNCIYEEANAIFYLGNRNGKYKDNPKLIQDQMLRYANEKYPPNNGLVTCMIMIRRHNQPDVVNAMEYWWEEIKYGSRRDQLSFNYISWKHNFNFIYLPGDSRDNKWFKQRPGHNK